MNAFTIKDIENLSGVKAHTIRIWEQRYNFLCPQRTDTNIRYYSSDELKTILNIALLNKYGFKISHINKMKPEEVKEKILLLSDSNAILEKIVNDLVEVMIDLDMDKFEQILAGYIQKKGVERTVTQIIFPFLEKIGILWQTGNINPAQEHLVSNIIRQKLMAAIENCDPTIAVDRSVLLFLPEGEHHELGLLYMYYLLKNKGVNVIYLGANVPIKDAEYVVSLKKPDLVYVHLTATSSSFNLEKFLLNADRRFQQVPFVVSGQITQQYKKQVPPSVRLIKSLGEVTAFLSAF